MTISLKISRVFLILGLSAIFSIISVFSQTQSSGCTTINGFGSFVGETTTANVGTLTLDANETIQFSGTLDDNTSMTIRLDVTGAGNFTVEGTVPTAIVQVSGVYTITVTNTTNPGQDGNVSGNCQPASTSPNAVPNELYIEWSGYSDGRLDPNPNEPFAIYCQNGEFIFYEVPPGQVGVITARYPLDLLSDMDINAQLQSTNILRRLSDDEFIMILSGASKTFSLAACFESAGIEDSPPPAPGTTSSFGIQVTVCPQEYDPEIDCPDSDGDRVYDVYDECPDDNGFGRLSGCPDSDGDGYEDRVDWCPQEGFTLGAVEINGCPDPDEDGLVASPLAPVPDECPEVAGLIEDNGCEMEMMIILEVEETEVLTLFEFVEQQGAYLYLIVQIDKSQRCVEWTPGPYGNVVCTEYV